MNKISLDKLSSISQTLEDRYGSLGFEFQAFKVGWYNSFVQPIFKLKYDEDTVSFLIISAPRMFEDAFIPFLQNSKTLGIRDPIDQCMHYYFSQIPHLFPEYAVKVVHDFELHPNRRPKIIMQSVAHASGAAYFYHPHIMNELNGQKKMFGVCIHPKYGGWFALRAVIFFENVLCPDLERIPPPDVVPIPKERLKLLELFNNNWADWKYRDIIPVKEKYSDLQMKYFGTPPADRTSIVNEILQKSKTKTISFGY